MNSNLQDIEQEHHLRFSIEFRSIKDLSEPYCIYFKFNHPLIGIGRTSSFQAAKLIESTFNKEFQSHEFYMSRSALLESLSVLSIELWHNDKFQKDEFLGNFEIDLKEILNSELTKTEESVIRVLDIWLKEEFGQIRVVLYLEDLGQKDQAAVNAIPKQINDWELVVWRKAEEAKFIAELKARENEIISKAASEWIAKENKREEQSEKTIVQLSELEIKLRTRTLELQKREHRIAAAEEEYKIHMADLQKQIELKEEELNMNKNRLNEIKTNTFKENKSIKAEIQQKKEEILKIDEEIVKIRRQAETQDTKDLKKELTMKNLENLELLKKFEQVKEIKETFEAKLNQLKDDLSKTLRLHDYERKKRSEKEREDITKRRLELETIRYQHEEALQIKDIKENMVIFKSKLR